MNLPRPVTIGPLAPLRPVPRSVAEAVQGLLDGCGWTAEELARRAGIPASTLKSYTYEPENPSDAHRGLPAWRIPPLTLLTGDPIILDTLEAHVGRVAVPVGPALTAPSVRPSEATALAVRRFGGFLQRHTAAAGGRAIAEYEQLQAEAYRVIQAILLMVMAAAELKGVTRG